MRDGRRPTASSVFSTADFFRFENGKIAEHWDVVNVLPRMIALGQIQPPASAPKPPGGYDSKASLAFRPTKKRPGHFRPGRDELNSSNLRDQTQRKGQMIS